MNPNQPVFTILSFVGGGIRGLMSATILQRLANVRGGVVISNTSLLAGCSTGSIITSELLAHKTPGDLIDRGALPSSRGPASDGRSRRGQCDRAADFATARARRQLRLSRC